MSSDTVKSLAGVLALLGVYALIAVVFLRISAMIKRRLLRQTPGFSVTVHVMAFVAFLVGCLVAWLEYSSGNPAKDRLLLVPLLLPLCIYAYILTLSLVAYGLAAVYRLALRLLSGRES